MKILIEGEPKEIAELLQAIEGSKEQKEVNLSLSGANLARIIHNPESMERQASKDGPENNPTYVSNSQVGADCSEDNPKYRISL